MEPSSPAPLSADPATPGAIGQPGFARQDGAGGGFMVRAYLGLLLFHVKRSVCWLVNLAGFPGFVRAIDTDRHLDIRVKVQIEGIYTIITVNGIDVYFNRLSGTYDGVGYAPTDCSVDSTQESTPALAPPSFASVPTRTE